MKRKQQEEDRWALESESRMVRWVYLFTHWREWLMIASFDAVGHRWKGILTFIGGLVVWVMTGSFLIGLTSMFLVIAIRVWLSHRKPRDHGGWWSHANLSGALVDSGVLRRESQDLPTLSYRGKVQKTEYGETVVVGMPQARTLGDVTARRNALASALRVPANRLAVFQHEDDPANVVRIHLARARKTSVPSPLVTATRTHWAEPVRIGEDARGETVWFLTDEQNSLVGGQPGSGKTSFCKIPLAHFLLDPTTSIYALDGKGSVKDYGLLRPLCATFVSAAEDDCVEKTIKMLARFRLEIRERNASDSGEQPPGMLLFLEEYQDVRSEADKDQRDELDRLLNAIVRQGRAVSAPVLISTQRPSVDDLPSGARNLLSQRLALQMENRRDAELVLGATPEVPMPMSRGVGVWKSGGQRRVLLDRITEDQWRAVIRRATEARKHVRRAPVPEDDESSPEILPEDSPLLPVLSALADEPAGLTPTVLHANLPDSLREQFPTPRELGMWLTRHVELVERVRSGPGRVWRLTPAGRALVESPAFHNRKPEPEAANVFQLHRRD